MARADPAREKHNEPYADRDYDEIDEHWRLFGRLTDRA
jgi:hypothetical protein